MHKGLARLRDRSRFKVPKLVHHNVPKTPTWNLLRWPFFPKCKAKRNLVRCHTSPCQVCLLVLPSICHVVKPEPSLTVMTLLRITVSKLVGHGAVWIAALFQKDFKMYFVVHTIDTFQCLLNMIKNGLSFLFLWKKKKG